MRRCAIITHIVSLIHTSWAVQLSGVAAATASVPRDTVFPRPGVGEVVTVLASRAGCADIQAFRFRVKAIRTLILMNDNSRPIISHCRLPPYHSKPRNIHHIIRISHVIPLVTHIARATRIIRNTAHLSERAITSFVAVEADGAVRAGLPGFGGAGGGYGVGGVGGVGVETSQHRSIISIKSGRTRLHKLQIQLQRRRGPRPPSAQISFRKVAKPRNTRRRARRRPIRPAVAARDAGFACVGWRFYVGAVVALFRENGACGAGVVLVGGGAGGAGGQAGGEAILAGRAGRAGALLGGGLVGAW